jgi:Na+/H+-dicarboxylate symporter
MVPKNIFSAISLGKPLPVLFFSVIFGMALGSVWQHAKDTALTVIAAFNGALFKIIEWIMYGLPFGLCCLLAEQVAKVGPDIIRALMSYVIIFYGAAITVFVINTLLIKFNSEKSLLRSITDLKEPLIVALATTSSFASIPSALRILEESFKLDKRVVNLMVPIGINMNPQGLLLFATISTVFIAQLFNSSFSLQQYVIVMIGSILMAMAASGVPGGAFVPMIAVVLDPLGLPVNAAVILLFAIVAVIDPAITMVTVHANCTAAIVLNNWRKGRTGKTGDEGIMND